MSNHPPYKTGSKPGNSDWEEKLFILRALVGLAMFGIAFLSYPVILLLWLLGDMSPSWVPVLSLAVMAAASVGALVFPEKSPRLGVSFAFWALSWWKDVY